MRDQLDCAFGVLELSLKKTVEKLLNEKATRTQVIGLLLCNNAIAATNADSIAQAATVGVLTDLEAAAGLGYFSFADAALGK